MNRHHTYIILRNTNILEISRIIHSKDVENIKREDFLLLKEYAINISSISQKNDNNVTIGIWFDSKENANEFTKKLDKLTQKSN